MGICMRFPQMSNESTIRGIAIALAFVDSFRLVMLIAVGLALASAVVAFVMIGRSKRQMQQQ